MKFRGTKEGIWDLDRSDFFQIHTYMSYYQNNDYNVIAGGLLYPMEPDFKENENKDINKKYGTHSNNWLGNPNTKFIVDGIDLSTITDINSIKKSEEDFITRVKNLINQT